MMSPVASFENNYMSMVTASSPELPTSSSMGTSAIHHTSQSQPSLAPMLTPKNNQLCNPLSMRNGTYDSRGSSLTTAHETATSASSEFGGAGAAVVVREGLKNNVATTSGEAAFNAAACLREGHSAEGPSAVGGEEEEHHSMRNLSQGGGSHSSITGSASEAVASRRLPDACSSESIGNVFVSGADCIEDTEAVECVAKLDSHAISNAAVSQPATPDWHALDRSCGVEEAVVMPSLTVAGSSFETAPTGSCDEFSQKLLEDLEEVSEEDEGDAAQVGAARHKFVPPAPRNGFVTPPRSGTLDAPSVAESADGRGNAIQSHPVTAHASPAACSSAPESELSHGEGMGVCASADTAGGSQPQGQAPLQGGVEAQTERGSIEGVSRDGRGYSVMSSARSMATLAEEVGWEEADVVAPGRPLSGAGVDLQFTVKAKEGGQEYVQVALIPWVRYCCSIHNLFCVFLYIARTVRFAAEFGRAKHASHVFHQLASAMYCVHKAPWPLNSCSVTMCCIRTRAVTRTKRPAL